MIATQPTQAMNMAKKPALSAQSLDETRRNELYKLLGDWHTAQAKSAAWRAKELELRGKIAEFFAGATEGTNSMTLDYGKVLKLNVKVNRSIVPEQLEALKNLAIAGKNDNILKLLDTVVKYKPDLVTGEWKKLGKDDIALLADVVTERPGTPELSIETPAR